MPTRSLAASAKPDQCRPLCSDHPERGQPEPRQPRTAFSLPSDETFLARYGDAIDDRVAEILDELLTERESVRRPGPPAAALRMVGLLLAGVAAAVLLRHDALSWAVWPAAAVACLVMTLAIAVRRPR